MDSVHSPAEKLKISSVPGTYDLIKGILESF